MTTDSHAKTELELYAYNTYALYGQFCAIIKNLQRKIAAGRYDASLAPKLWQYWVDEAARAYCREFATPASLRHLFPASLRRELAAEIAATEYERLTNGEYA